MDETGLFWRRVPSSGLATTPRPGVKLEKTRISLAFCSNATGDDLFEIWAIGKAKQPLALRGFNLDRFGIKWRNNIKVWMTTDIMVEWLDSFYAHIQRTKPDEKILLVLDNFSPHTDRKSVV